ncbi:MAG: hypothetical protein WCD04_14760 [Terriglobia bacterium]
MATTDNGRRATDRLRGFLATNAEGRGFNPAVTGAPNCLLIEGWEPLCGGVKTPPFRSPNSKRQSVARNPG